jgi:hypothetical protein
MLANLQHFNLASLLKNFHMSHIFLFYLFYRDFDPCFQVFGHFHQAKLALAKRFLKLIKVKNIAVAHNLLKLLFPGLFFTFC